MNPIGPSLQRIWQPRRGLFWLMLAVNGLSSVLVAYLQIGQPPEALRWLLSLLALVDTLLGWWLLRRLWRETGPGAGPIQG
jgi:hypothetical protein